MISVANKLIFGWLMFAALAANAQTGSPRQVRSFDTDWFFVQMDPAGAQQITFDDGSWQRLDVPHDWSILGKTDTLNKTGRGGGYLPAGIGWYRKHFTLDNNTTGKKVFIHFDGVMANSDVWINGYHLGKRPYGYSSFEYELTGHLNYGKGKSNVLAVRADNSVQPASRYYTGAGIYRHVRLIVTDPVHIKNWGVFITTPTVSAEKAVVRVNTTVLNESDKQQEISLQTTLLSPDGKKVAEAVSKGQIIKGGDSLIVSQDILLDKPALWDLAHPQLYKAVSSVKGKGVLDETTSSFGIRDIKFTADQGFLLNGTKVMIKGVCLHHDGGAVGAAVPLGVWERRLTQLKAIGVNGIRTAHNPPSPEFLDLCDRMGLLVMDENLDTWEADKVHGKGGYQTYFNDWGLIDTRDLVQRDRNHPSVVIYSVGNEIRDNLNDSAGFKKYKDLQDICHKYDPSRPVTMALFRPGSSKVYTSGFAEKMDVVGQNYREDELVAAHEAHPDWKVIGTENGHSREAWLELRDHVYMAGQFLWVGFDYLGEALWPNVINNKGLFDHTGGTKPLTLQRESWWSAKPVVHIVRSEWNGGGGPVVADWTPADLDAYKDAKVMVYSNCDEVELFLNGKSLGVKSKNTDDAPIIWEMPFEKGIIKATGRNNKKDVATEQLRTAGKPAAIVLSADRTQIKDSWDDISYITAQVVDADGIRCPKADNSITFSATGAGIITVTDNGDTRHQAPYTSQIRNSYNGKAIAIVKANVESGRISIKANSPGLKEGKIEVLVNR